MRRRALVALGLLVLLPCAGRAQEVPASAEAAPPPAEPASRDAPPLSPAAADRLGRGTALFDRAHYDAALTEFLAAHAAMEGHPLRHQVLYNIAFCYERAFRYDEAIRYYERYLADGGAADPRAAEVRSILASLEGLLGRVRIATSLERAEVWVDDHHVGRANVPLRLPAGAHTVEVRADGHLPSRREVRVLAGQDTPLAIELEPVDAFRGLPPEAFAVSAAATLAALAAGLSVGVASLVEGQALRARLAEPSGWRVTPAEIQAVEQLSLAADLLYGVAALGGVVSVVLLALTRWDGDEGSVSLAPGGLRGRF